MNLNNMRKGYYTARQCWVNRASYTKYASHNRTLSVMHDAQICWSLNYCFYKSALKITNKTVENTFGCTIIFFYNLNLYVFLV